MKQILLSVVMLVTTQLLVAQFELEHLGLANQQLTDLDINYGFIAVGTDRHGVYYQSTAAPLPGDWLHIPMDSSVQAVYPHKSGPIGWAISAGIQPLSGEPPYIFCSHMGEDFAINTTGITPANTFGIRDLDGFPDPTICGETYAVGDRALYRRNFIDTIWEPVLAVTVEGNLETVKVRQTAPGVVLVGGADGFAGIFLAKSLDFGESWEDISPFGMALSIDFTGPSADTIVVAAFDRIFLSTDAGENWETIFEDGLEFRITEILFDEVNNTIYAAGGMALDDKALLMRSIDLGLTWQQIALDTLDAIIGLEMVDDWVYFITRDDGVYRLREFITDVEEISGEQLELGLTVRPNPCVGHCVISYALPKASDVALQVVGPNGAVISTLVDRGHAPGVFQAEWEPANVPPGLYYIVLDANKRSLSRPVVVQRR